MSRYYFGSLDFLEGEHHFLGMSDKLSVKDKLEIAEAICTIVVSVMALWGTISAFNHDLFKKVNHLIEHYHHQISLEEQSDNSCTKPVMQNNSEK